MARPLVSICCLTHNHEPYILECLEGFLVQKCEFPFEILIHDDASTDGTAEIIQEYEAKYPEIIKPIYQRENQYSKREGSLSLKYNFPRAQGKYIAMCEGDDYWVDPLKLQKQVDFLEQNPDFILSYTNRHILIDGILKISKPLSIKSKLDKTEIPHVYVPTLTVVFKNVMMDMPRQMYATLIDASLFLYLSQYGSFSYLDESTGVYRMHKHGLYSGGSALYKAKTSTKARITAWIYLKDIDRVSLAHKIIYLLQVKSRAEVEQKKYFGAFVSQQQRVLFLIYTYTMLIFKKIKKDIM